jgi:hypothetical protein
VEDYPSNLAEFERADRKHSGELTSRTEVLRFSTEGIVRRASNEEGQVAGSPETEHHCVDVRPLNACGVEGLVKEQPQSTGWPAR